jgi:arylsulfatase A-like enzyme
MLKGGGRISREIIHVTDWFPTLVVAAGTYSHTMVLAAGTYSRPLVVATGIPSYC